MKAEFVIAIVAFVIAVALFFITPAFPFDDIAFLVIAIVETYRGARK